jgi:putative pyruvate formate lyase activating enzyme
MAKVALVSLHQGEEPCLVGEKGAGTVFFSYCNLKCVFCQNHEISHGGKGQEVTDEHLAKIFLQQQARGAAVLDLVTPTHYVPQILTALRLARRHGFDLPVVYNSSAYEMERTIDSLRGNVDIYLPDLKYREEETARRYSAAPDYFRVAARAILQMYNQVGKPQFDAQGRMTRGVIVRHLVLPGCRQESMRILDWLWANFQDNIYLSLMNQYTPLYKAKDFPAINRRLTTFEYDSVTDYAYDLGFRRCYIQQGKTASAKFVPQFDGSGI